MPKILLVDDTQSLVSFLRDILARKGYVVHSTADPANALLLLKNQKPDLVLAGDRLQGRKDWELVESIRASHPKTPLAVLSSSVSKEGEERAESLGCAGFVYKNLSPEALLQKVLDVCAAHAPSSKELSLTRSKGRILVVDDEEVIRTVLSRFLKSKGYEVVTAVNGVEALEKVKKERPHLILLDIRMPELDGFGVLKAVHAIDREVAVMMITANSDIEEARKTMEMGACDYIIKPFHLDYLETTVITKLLMVTA